VVSAREFPEHGKNDLRQSRNVLYYHLDSVTLDVNRLDTFRVCDIILSLKFLEIIMLQQVCIFSIVAGSLSM